MPDNLISILACSIFALAGCSDTGHRPMTSRLQVAPFGVTPDRAEVSVFTLTNSHGVEIRAVNLGAIIVSLRVPDQRGQMDDIVLGFDNLQGYLDEHPYFGAIVGRYANRIANGQFTIDDSAHMLARNDGPNHLHGGLRGFDKVVWTAEAIESPEGASVRFSHISPDGDEGYPGRLEARVTYTLTDGNELVIDYEATTDRPTPVNLTQHSYFNLAGAGTGDVLDHEVTIFADHLTPIDSTLIPTGEIRAVQGTPFDFTAPEAIGRRIDAADPQLRRAGGYDHNFVLKRPPGDSLVLAAIVREPSTGRVMHIRTTEPGIQFYTGNFLDGSITGKGGRAYGHRGGFCLETQHFPDSPNRPEFPSVILEPGQTYRSRTVYWFGVENGSE
jgi:aldose 1-epimerase